MNDEELLRRSELIVFGQWIGQASLSLPAAGGAAPAAASFGIIAVERVFKGPGGKGPVLVAMALPTAPRVSDELTFRSGQRGLWLLRRKPGDPSSGWAGLFLADHPQRFVESIDTTRLSELEKRLPAPR